MDYPSEQDFTPVALLEYKPGRTEAERRPPKPMWGPGPWHREPDRFEWRHRSGLPLLIVRSPVTGSLCGYVGVPPEHPLYGVNYSGCALHLKAADCVRVKWRHYLGEMHHSQRELWLRYGRLDERTYRPRGKYEGLFARLNECRDHARCDHTPEGFLNVHGGITYSDACDGGPICHVPREGEPPHVFWFGFDTAHAGDITPGMDAMLATLPGAPFSHLSNPGTYRTLDYVKRETEQLADQIVGFKGRLYCKHCHRRRPLQRLTCKCGAKGPWVLR